MPALQEYRKKRRFTETPEPRGKVQRKDAKLFVIQKHAARRLHYDLRLEVDGVLKSWAVPKGPSLNPGDKRLAIQVEDHPFEYRTFEGTIPKGHYGAGEVIIWDEGTYEPEGEGNAATQLARGELKFRLHGKKLNGSFVLVRLRRGERNNEWLLIKHRDAYADTNWNAEEHAESVVSGRALRDTTTKKRSENNRTVSQAPGIPGAVKAAMSTHVSVTLATLADKPFSDPQWLFEIKWDGVRTLAFLRDGEVRLFSRSGRDISAENPEFYGLGESVNAQTAILDGEIVSLDASGRTDFQKLQNRLGVRNPSQKLIDSVPLTYYFFDLLYCNGMDIRKSPLLARKELLHRILQTNEQIRYSEHQLEKGKELFAAAKEKGLEGIVGKQIESPYTGNRTSLWLKFKIVKELDAVIAGWTAPRRSRQYFGALVLGLYEGKELKFIGSAGTGMDQKTQKEIFEQLQKLKTPRASFRAIPKLREKVEWVAPQLVARIKYGNWTEGKHLRMPVFLSLRKDRSAEDCTFEAANFSHDAPAPDTQTAISGKLDRNATKRNGKAKTAKPRGKSTGRPGDSNIEEELRHGTAEDLRVEIDGRDMHFTHLNKIYFPESGIKKRELLAYYYRMAGYLLPFLKDRPLVLRRYPNGIEGSSFFQKEAPNSLPDWMARATVYSEERGGKMDYVMANDRASLLFLSNLGCIDHNPWSSRADRQEFPDYLFFDLDPTPGTSFETVLRVARAIHRILEAAEMVHYLKTSGATGFHIYVPLEPRYTYEQTKTFAQIVGQLVAAELPKDTTVERSVKKRPRGRVLLDALQNARGKPLAAVYSVRAQPSAPVSTPITAQELQKGVDPAAWTVATMDTRMKEVEDLWKDFWKKRQTLTRALQLLEGKLGGRK